MKRLIDKYLAEWKEDKHRKPLLLRGARQVGKTYAVRQLGNSFESFVEINFELEPEIKIIFEKNLNPDRIIKEISLLKNQEIIPKKTLLFFDEIQIAPAAVTSLRYFYEMMPDLHVISAGSLLDFTLQQVGIPVGRVSSLYMYPMSFIEFLMATGHELLSEVLTNEKAEFTEVIHNRLLDLIGEYLAIGGMPEAVKCWRDTHDALLCFKVHHSLLDTYRADFDKYAGKLQIKYLSILFDNIPRQLANKFVYSNITENYRSRELAPALDLLVTAGVIHKVHKSSGNGVPLGAEMNPKDFKILFMDVALAQAVMGLDLGSWIINPKQEFINKGPIVEAFVGQELLAYMYPVRKQQLFYWRREERSSIAEIDYLIQKDDKIIPIEVKGGAGTTLKSMHAFLESHLQSPYGIRFSTQSYSVFQKIHSFPLYDVHYSLSST